MSAKGGALERLKAWWRGDAGLVPPTPPEKPQATKGLRISKEAVQRALDRPKGPERAAAFAELFPIPKPPPSVPGGAELHMAMDDAMAPIYAWAEDDAIKPLYGFASDSIAFHEGIGFLGFPYLAELTQRAEYRVAIETRAKEMTREWIELEYRGDKPDNDKLADLQEEIEKFNLRAIFQKAAEHEGAFGRGQIYIDTGATDKPAELESRLLMSPKKIVKGGLKAFRNVEPIWTYPDVYNANDPLKPDYYRPTKWWVMAKRVHRSRMLMMVSREMPDLLKPSYTFAGLSMSQMGKPYVDNWLRARQSVSDLMHAFSIVVLATNMGSTLQDGDTGQTLFDRLDLFNALRDNRGSFAIDKESEDMKILTASLASLDKLQAQAQEHQAAVWQMPLVKLLGITPSGLNASSDGEIRVFYDHVASEQEGMFAEPLTICLDILQLNKWGEIDPNIKFKFVPLWQLDQAGEALVQKTEAEIDAIYVESGVIDPQEVRKRLASDPHSQYAGLDVDDVPEPPEELDEPETKGDPARQAETRAVERSGV